MRIGIALAADELCACLHGDATNRVRVPIELPDGNDGLDEILSLGFDALSKQLQAMHGRTFSGAEVTVALLPPLVDARTVPLPPLRTTEVEAVFRRDAARYFLGGHQPRAIGVRPASRSRAAHGQAAPVFAAAASAALLTALRNVVTRTGWQLRAVVPAHDAWLAAATRDATLVLAHTNDADHAVLLRDGHIVQTRKAPHNTLDALVPADAEPGVAIVLGGSDDIDATLSAKGWTVQRPSPASAVELAAAFAPSAKLLLLPPAAAAERRLRARTVNMRLVGVAAALLVVAAGVELWGVRRELSALKNQRFAIKARVTPLLAERDTLTAIEERIAIIAQLPERSMPVAAAIRDLAILLPADAHVTAFHTTGDTLTVSAEGDGAGAAIRALRAAPSLTAVRLKGVVERDLEDGATAIERFTLEARLNTGAESPARASAAARATRAVRRTP